MPLGTTKSTTCRRGALILPAIDIGHLLSQLSDSMHLFCQDDSLPIAALGSKERANV